MCKSVLALIRESGNLFIVFIVERNGCRHAPAPDTSQGPQGSYNQTAVANAITSAVISGGLAVAVQDRSGAAAATASTLTSVTVSGNAGAVTLTGNGITRVVDANTNQNLTVTVAARIEFGFWRFGRWLVGGKCRAISPKAQF